MTPYIILLDGGYNRGECELKLKGKVFNSINEVEELCKSFHWYIHSILSLDEFVEELNDEFYPTEDWVINIIINKL